MGKGLVLLALATSSLSLAGCTSNTALRAQIAAIEQRVNQTEAQVTAGTGGIGQPGKDVRAAIAYRPIIDWAAAFSNRPENERTISFRQVERDGDLYKKSHKCIVFGDKRDGERAWIHESDSTKIKLAIGQFSVVAQDDGLDLNTRLSIDAKTQVAANFRPRCQGGSVGTNVGVTAEANPNALLNVKLAKNGAGVPAYRVRIERPDHIGLEMRVLFQWFRVGFTVPFNLPRDDLAKGELDLMLSRQGEIKWPDGTIRQYHLALVAPDFSTTKQGVGFATDVKMDITTPSQ
ncbi:hypothetical protein [Sphingomonas sp. TWP1-3-1]|uniref:hypothetical protein n=1 Tax=Sphingomonas sp. TWP1-3-1 TaxID=2804612 RepID=UPI003CF6D128